jgi:hypothetical protein
VAILSYINNAFNFLLYGLTSQKYREESAKIIFSFDGFKKNKNLNSKLKSNDKKTGEKLNTDSKASKTNPANTNIKKSSILKEDSKLLAEASKSTISTSLKNLKFDFNQINLNSSK